MTDSQIKYWTLQETERHNREMERYNEGQLSVSQRDVSVKEGLLPYQQRNLQSQAELNAQQSSLIEYEKAESVSKTAKNWTGVWDQISHDLSEPFNKAKDTVLKLFF